MYVNISILYLNVVFECCTLAAIVYAVDLCFWLDVMNFRSLLRGATCNERPLSFRTGGGRSWQVLLYLVIITFDPVKGQKQNVKHDSLGTMSPFGCIENLV